MDMHLFFSYLERSFPLSVGHCPPVRLSCPIIIFVAVAARFGIGRDFFLNLVLTICGYIPGAFVSRLGQVRPPITNIQVMSTISTYRWVLPLQYNL